jgi:S1-C subfamily serine protease
MENAGQMTLNIFDLSVYLGSSGGAIFNDKLEVIGMVEGYINGGFALGIRSEDINLAIMRYKLQNNLK